MWPSIPVEALAEGDGRMIWGQAGLVTSPNMPYNDRTGRWGASSDLSADTSFSARLIRSASSPTEPELIEAHTNSNGQYRVHRWDGNAWTLDWVDSGGGSSTSALVPRFELAYDNVGNAVMFYSANSTGTTEISYRIYTNATDTWSAEQTYDAVRTTGAVKQIQVVNRAGTDEFAIAWNDVNMDLSATYYDLSADTFSAEPSAALSTTLSTLGAAADPRTQLFDLALERSSGELLICWSNLNVTDLVCRTRGAGTAGAWSGANSTYTTFTNEPQDMHMARDPDPASNKIAIVASDDLGVLNAAIWDGSAWGNFSALDTTIDTLEVTTMNCDVEWVRSGTTSQAVVTYDDANSTGIDWAVFNPATPAWTVQSDITTAFAPSNVNDKHHDLVRNPLDSDEMISLVVDSNNDLSVKRVAFDGSNYTWTSIDDTGGTSHEAGMNTNGGWTVAFAYYAYVPTPTLSVDIVDASNNSVASPSLSMSAVTSGNTCQTTTGTLGTGSELIRVNNTTTTPGWSLTAAATGGAASNWSATTDSYDFNDSSGTGCTDGADADSLAGQLTIDASGGTRTVDELCTTTGVSLGSSSAFVEGTTDSITVLTASGSANTNCTWDLTGVSLSQKIPPYRLPGTYTLQLTLTATAN